MSKQTRNILIVLIILAVLYFVMKFNSRNKTQLGSFDDPDNPSSNTGSEPTTSTTGARLSALTTGRCVDVDFKDLDLSGRTCAGSVINENRVLKFGDQSCEVLLLQQRLNSMQHDKYILQPTGQFDCNTKFKLNLLMGVPQISLNMFSPDEQIGFNELQTGTNITPYSYMDVNTKIN